MRKKTRSLEQGTATVLMVAIVAGLISVAALLGTVLMKSLGQARLQADAENAAVAGADSLRGLVAGYPCDVVRSFEADVSRCEIIGTDVLVELTRDGMHARARAGEP